MYVILKYRTYLAFAQATLTRSNTTLLHIDGYITPGSFHSNPFSGCWDISDWTKVVDIAITTTKSTSTPSQYCQCGLKCCRFLYNPRKCCFQKTHDRLYTAQCVHAFIRIHSKYNVLVDNCVSSLWTTAQY